jgi:antitoxin HigA-1
MSLKKSKNTGIQKISKEITADEIWNEEKMKKIAAVISVEARKRTPEQRLKTEIVAIKYRMYTYLDNEHIKEKMQILDFVKMYLKVLNMTQKEFASKIGMEEPNLHKYFTGERKLNKDIVMKLGAFSHTRPALWFSIQSKNDLLEIEKSEIRKYRKYDYEKLSTLFRAHKNKNQKKTAGVHNRVHA